MVTETSEATTEQSYVRSCIQGSVSADPRSSSCCSLCGGLVCGQDCYLDQVITQVILLLSVCREKAVFSLQAHVFQIDPETKKKWLPSSTTSVRVAYYHDPGKKTYRIIAIENNKVSTCCMAPHTLWRRGDTVLPVCCVNKEQSGTVCWFTSH